MSRHPVITIFGLAVLVLANLSATAQERCEACGGKDRLENPKANVAPPAAKTIYNNLGTGSNLFNKSAGWTVAGPSSGVTQQSIALPFKPSAGATLGAIEVGAGYMSGANNMVVTINEDNNGLPGNPLGSMVISNLPPYGWPYISCFWPLPRPFFPWPCVCIVIVVIDWPPPIILNAGEQYWITLSANPADPTFRGVWNYNVAGTAGTLAINNDNGWQLTQGVLPAVGLLGK